MKQKTQKEMKMIAKNASKIEGKTFVAEIDGAGEYLIRLKLLCEDSEDEYYYDTDYDYYLDSIPDKWLVGIKESDTGKQTEYNKKNHSRGI